MYRVEPDIKFKKEIARISGSAPGECMQCGNCSVVCSLAPDDRPFPRKEMVWAGWGLKDRLFGNPDVWLCHQCGDCSTHCPRNVKPADVIAAVRKAAIREYARPGFIGKMLSKPGFLPLAVALPVVVITLILSLAGTFRIPDGPVDYSSFFPHLWLNTSFTLITLIFYGMAISGMAKFWREMKLKFPPTDSKQPFLRSFFKALGEVILHKKFTGCNSKRPRNLAHILVFFGFVLLLLVTLYAIVAAITHNYPLRFTNPFKIMGNLASLMLYTGLIIMIWQRIFNPGSSGKSSYEDWLLLISMLLLTLTGTLVEAARFLDWDSAYHIYFFHLVCVWFVIMYLPFTKLGHIFYRTLAMIYARTINRN